MVMIMVMVVDDVADVGDDVADVADVVGEAKNGKDLGPMPPMFGEL